MNSPPAQPAEKAVKTIADPSQNDQRGLTTIVIVNIRDRDCHKSNLSFHLFTFETGNTRHVWGAAEPESSVPWSLLKFCTNQLPRRNGSAAQRAKTQVACAGFGRAGRERHAPIRGTFFRHPTCAATSEERRKPPRTPVNTSLTAPYEG